MTFEARLEKLERDVQELVVARLRSDLTALRAQMVASGNGGTAFEARALNAGTLALVKAMRKGR